SCRVSSRLRAVTLTESSVVALVAGVPAAGAASCAHATGTDDNRTQPMARLRCLRFMGLPLPGMTLAAGGCRRLKRTLGGGPRGGHRTFVQWDGRHGPADTRRTATGAGRGVVDVVPDRAGRAVFPDVRGLPRLQRHPVRADRGA